MKSLLVLATALLAGASFAAGPKEGPKRNFGPRPGMMEGAVDPIVRLIRNPKVAKEIGITDEQLKKIDEINKASRDPELQKNLREAMKNQAELLKAEKIDEAAVMAEIDKVFDIRKELAKRQTKRIIAIKSTLTPEQIQKALEIMKARAAERRAKAKPETLEGRPPKARKSPKADGERPEPPKDDAEKPEPPKD